jgi:hypothetical protein
MADAIRVTVIGQAERRRSERVGDPTVTCDGGHLLDLSTHGARIRGPLLHSGSEHVIHLSHPRLTSDPIKATVVWTKEIEPGLHEMGLRFNAASAKDVATIVGLARLAVEEQPGLHTAMRDQKVL